MSAVSLPKNTYGNVDIRRGLPPGVCFLPVNAPLQELELAGIDTAQGLIAYETGYTGSRPCFAPRLLAPIGWQEALKEWRESECGKAALRELAEREACASAAKAAKRREAALRAQATRAENKALRATDYGELLFWLRAAQRESDCAKSRSANACRQAEYFERDESIYARANYRRSRNARARDYRRKEAALQEAVQVAPLANVSFGWVTPDDGMPIVYFDLSSGQVSFHSATRLAGPDYEGFWDGIRGASAERIQAAIRELIANGVK